MNDSVRDGRWKFTSGTGNGRAKVTEALRSSTFAGHIMPYGPTKFAASGQNEGAGPVNTQVQNGDIKVIFPDDFADAKPIFPVPA